MIVCFVDIDGIVDHHCLNFLLIICRPDYTRTTKKQKPTIGSIEYTIKKGIITVISGIKKADFRFKTDENQAQVSIHLFRHLSSKFVRSRPSSS